MGLFDCCFAQPAVDVPTSQNITLVVEQQTLPVSKQQQPEVVIADSTASQASGPPAADRESDWSKSWSKLNQTETTAVKQTLLKVSELIERFAEGSAEREAPVHALKKALQLVATDCHASYASISVVSSDQQTFLVMGCVGSSHEATTLPNMVSAVTGSDSSVERLLKIGSGGGAAASSAAAAGSNGSPPFSWSIDDGVPPPSDWVQLQQAGIRHIHAMAMRAGPDQLLGVLNLGFKHEPCLDMGSMGPHLFSTYMSLVSATLTAVVRDPGLNAYVCLARDLAAATSLDGIMQAALLGSRTALTRLKGLGSSTGNAACGAHTWLRLALISGDKSAAALFDDLSQAGVTRTSKRSGTGHSGSSAQWVATIQAAGGLVRTNIPMKNTILRIALTNKKQVLIPDVQKLINQLGNVNTDLFASRLLRPPSSVLLLPLRASGVGIYGALYCLADVHTEFSEVAKQLKEVAELLGAGLNRMLSGPLSNEYMGIQQLNHEQLLARDNTNESGNSLGATGATGHSSGIYGGAITPSTVTPATTAGSLPTGPYSYSTTTASSSLCGAAGARSEGSFMAAATAGGALEFGSTVGTHASWTGSMGGSMCSMGGSFTGVQGLGRSFTTKQVASSTNAVATGITEKLNQKRIDAAMQESEDEALAALQLVAQIGEGGFAKVFRGLYRGLVVAVKVVAVGDPSNERAVMKNAHEIAILRSSSHPNIIQAYSCMTDVHIRDVIALCTRQAPRAQRQELIAALTACCGNQQQRAPTGSGGSAIDDATCHIEVVEYCDLGNLTSAIRSQIFSLPSTPAGTAHSRHLRRGSRSSRHSGIESAGGYDSSTDGEGSCAADGSMVGSSSSGGPSQGAGSTAAGSTASLPGRLRVNMRWLLLTLLEVAEGMAYLHRMGVVHCDMKPANVLLKSSNADIRGFTAKVSDFGLSRVEDDDTCATFPFNSCGTAAYVAPEALITTKKVNASVDVYAFGVMMWELFVGQRPYGNMSQQKVVEEVVLRGLRPCFPVGTPPGYAQLAAACWHATANARPSFQEVIARLQAMLHQTDESEAAAAASCSLTGSEAWGGRADGLGTPPAPLMSAASSQRGSTPGTLSPSATPQAPASGRPSIPRSRAAPGGGSVGEANAAAAAAIAEAAAAWNKQQGSAGKIPGQRVSFDAGRPSSMQPAAVQQLQAAQLLQWQQQQQQLLRQEHQSILQNQSRLGRSLPDDPAAAAAVKAAIASGGEAHQRAKSAGQPMYQQQAAAAAALAAAGSVYEFQQVGFGGETVVGTGSIGGSRYSSGGGSAAAGMMGTAAQQQQLLQAATAAGYTAQVRRGPSRSKTFTAGTGGKQNYEQLLAAMSAQAAAGAAGGSDAGASGSGAASLSFNYAAGGDQQQQQQQLALQQQQLQMLQRQQQLLQQQGYNTAAGLLAGQQQRQLQQQFTFAAPAGGQYSTTAAAIASLQQQQHQQQLTLNAARELLARQAASMQASSSNQGSSGSSGGTQQQQLQQQ